MQTESLDDTTDHGTTEEENGEIGGPQSDENDESSEEQLGRNDENSEEQLDENGESTATQPGESGENSAEPSQERPAGAKRKKPTGRPLGSPNTKTTLKMSGITQIVNFMETVLLRVDALTKQVQTLSMRIGIPDSDAPYRNASLALSFKRTSSEHSKAIAEMDSKLSAITSVLSEIQSKLTTLWE